MSATAIVMLIVAISIVWGGLAASIVFLRRRPEKAEMPYEEPGLRRDDYVREHFPHPTRDT